MKALTILQPSAHLIMIGSKWVENRGWATRYRELLAIHAGQSPANMLPDEFNCYPDISFGAIIAVARLANCFSLNYIRQQTKSGGLIWQQILKHVHTEGPYCWILGNVVRLEEPIPIAGRQRLWQVPPNVDLKLQAAWMIAQGCQVTKQTDD